ncbi:hypothetical protein [Noviherbaspirillum sp.]|uniref:hypothetical protein n=1 Tax=Noviherbaspirillum sp. TaxID=1926288 RepID=UPI002B45EEF6|nr:hypothetical protein [Noviherbaspirillum sp.]HJV80597.1 hypothetical protein [Noviherbaspirillum sp.]
MWRILGDCLSGYCANSASPPPSQGNNGPSVRIQQTRATPLVDAANRAITDRGPPLDSPQSRTSAVPSINHEAVGKRPIDPPLIVKDVAASSSNGIGFKIYSFGGALPPDLSIEHSEISHGEIAKRIAATDKKVGIGRMEYSSQRMYSCDFRPCVPVFAYYRPADGEDSDNDVPMALYHAEAYITDRLDELLASPKHGQATDIFVVTRNADDAMRTRNGVLKQSAISLYVNSKLPAGTKFHIIEVSWGPLSLRVAADKIEVWTMQDQGV